MSGVKTVTDLLIAAPTVNVIVGDRVTPLNRTMNFPLPAVTVQLITTTPTNTLLGDQGFDRERIQIDSWAVTYKGAHDLADAIRRVMTAQGYLLGLQLDNFDDSAQLSGVYQVTQEYDVWSKFS
jgi:hypothetical protein